MNSSAPDRSARGPAAGSPSAGSPSVGSPSVGSRAGVRRVVIASLVGTSLEWYDFFIYGTAAALVFNQLFFPSFEPLVGTLLAFTTYAVGFIARPVGGIVFGHYGDKVGRKQVLVATLVLMGVATFAIGLLPTYASIGVWAPILLVTLRFLQGLGLGGEWGGAVLMTMESGDSGKRGRNASWPQVGVPVGLLLANGVLSLMGVLTGDEAFLSWGWRVPFLLSGLLVMVGLWIRLSLAESPLFAAEESALNELVQGGSAQGESAQGELKEAKARAPIVEVLRRYPKQVLLALGARVGVDVVFYVYVLFITTYVVTYLGLPRTYALNAVLIAAAGQTVLIPLFGSLSDRFGRRPIYLIGAVGAGIWTFVFFALLDTGNFALIVLAAVVALALHAAMYGPQAAFIAEMFPTAVRYTGASMGYQVAGILGGALAPIIATALLNRYQSSLFVSIYVLVVLVITVVCVLLARETATADLGGEDAEYRAAVAEPR
jgi:metabolite-proton symporter